MANKKRWYLVYWVLAGLLLLALARDFLANGRPLYCRINGETYWPGLRTVWQSPDLPYQDPLIDSLRINNLWKTFPYEARVFAPIPFSPGEINHRIPAEHARPGSAHPGFQNKFMHWLGTDDRGRDVAAGLVSGARIALLTGTLAMSLAFGIGLFLGALAGFYGDDKLRIQRGRLWMTLVGLPVAWFYAFTARQYILSHSGNLSEWGISLLIFGGIVLVFNRLGWLISKTSFGGKLTTVPADLIVMRLSEIFISTPKLMLLIVVAALLPKGQSIWLLIGLVGIMSWPNVARFVRAELLRVREMDYVTAARSLGFSMRGYCFAMPCPIPSGLR
jgi:peptide/nickel transport system permease protein